MDVLRLLAQKASGIRIVPANPALHTRIVCRDCRWGKDGAKPLLIFVDGRVLQPPSPGKPMTGDLGKGDVACIRTLRGEKAVRRYGLAARFGAVLVWMTSPRAPDSTGQRKFCTYQGQ